MAGAIAGFISYGIQRNLNHSGANHLANWQWLFIIEGVPTIAWGFLVWALLPRFPEHEVEAKRSLFFKSEEEKRLIMERTRAGMFDRRKEVVACTVADVI